jgi:hypothetical protein
MAYVPPNRRKEKTIDQKNDDSIKIVQEASDKHFPSLGGGGPVVSRSTISYGEKAKEWEQKRIESEIKDRVDARMAQIRQERMKQEEVDRSTMPNFNRKQHAPKLMPLPAPVPLPERQVQSEWTTIQKKVRKPKKEINFDEEPDYDNKYDHLAEDQDSRWD